jgi:intracellular multiplication protein IcmB
MGILGKLKSSLFSVTGLLPESKMMLDTIVDDTLVCTDGSMGTMVRLQGLRTMKAIADYDRFLDDLSRRLTAALSIRGHAIQIYFQRDPSHARQVAAELVRPARNAAEYFGLDLERQNDMREEMLAKRIIPEVSYIVFWTRPGALDDATLKRMEQETKYPPLWPRTESSQNVFNFSEKIAILHRSWVTDVLSTFKLMEISVPVMTGQQALRAIRLSPRPGFDNPDWYPWLPGEQLDASSPRSVSRSDLPIRDGVDADASDDLWTNLVDQVWDGCDVEILNAAEVRIGSTIWSSFQMNRGPLDQQPFSKLLKRVGQGDEIPWRASFLIETSVLGRQKIKQLFASLTGITSPDNSKPLYLALRAALEAEAEGRPPVGMQAIFSTWASVGELKRTPTLLQERANRLQRSVESWGRCEVDTGGDPFETTMGGMLGIRPISPAARCIPPIKNALTFLPLDRDASAMERGSLTFLTDYDTPFPFDVGSEQQLSSADFVCAPPGSGKSGLLSTMIQAFVLSSRSQAKMVDKRLPFIGIIDVGYSQIGTVNTIREALPPNRRNEAQYHRLQNTEEYSINPFDTQPGFRKPISNERSFLINFFTLLVTPIGADIPPPRLAELAAAVIDQAYRAVSDVREDKGQPKTYTRGYDREADAAIDKFQISYAEGRTTFWQLVDDLHRVGTSEATEAAILVQRNAVPRIEELGKILNSEIIASEWGGILVPNSAEKLVDSFKAALTFVAGEFKMLSRPTRFRLGEGRLVVLDLGTIATGTGAYADRTAAISYMLARSVLTKGYYLTDDLLVGAPPIWRDWHVNRVQLYRDAPKRLVYDEFHKTKNSPGVRAQVITDLREGRKWNVGIQILSQSFLDFDEEMLENATSVYILGLTNDTAVARVATRYNLSSEAVTRLRDGLNGPTRRGAPFLAIYRMKDGSHEHYLFNVKTAYELWSDSTTPNDVSIRTRVAKQLGYVMACFALSRRFSSGSAESEVVRLSNFNPNESPLDVIATLVVEEQRRLIGSS